MSRVTFKWLSLALLAGCGPPRFRPPKAAQARMAEDFFQWRALALGIGIEAAKSRDAALSETTPPHADEAVAVDAAVIWRDFCAGCHGIDGKPPLGVTPTPKTWGGGAAIGFFFGGDRMRAGVYRAIADGKGKVMPAWGDRLAKEQIWALVRQLESL